MAVRLATHAMGTRFEIVLGGEGEGRLRAAGESGIAEIEDCHRRYSAFARDSLIAQINRQAHERPVRVDEDTFALLRLCRNVHRGSGGAFDVTLGPMMEAWGFRERGGGTIRDARARCGMDAMVLDELARTVRLGKAGMGLDLGGVAKGHALDLAADMLRELGIRRALLHGGTSGVVAIGSPPDQDAWRIAIAGTRYSVRLCDAAMGVSSPGGRMVEREGRPVGHVMDPRTGEPVAGVAVAAVVGPCGAEADAWSTALVVLGSRFGRAGRMGRSMSSLVVDRAGAVELADPVGVFVEGVRAANPDDVMERAR